MTEAGLRLLHLSDIHFLGSTEAAIARNADLRKQIESDPSLPRDATRGAEQCACPNRT